jgi:membrane protein implicated in regulation of membrane protease activity
MGCLLDVVVAVVLFVVIGLAAGEASAGDGRFSIHLSTVPTLVFIALLLGYYFGYRRPAKRRRQAGQ